MWAYRWNQKRTSFDLVGLFLVFRVIWRTAFFGFTLFFSSIILNNSPAKLKPIVLRFQRYAHIPYAHCHYIRTLALEILYFHLIFSNILDFFSKIFDGKNVTESYIHSRRCHLHEPSQIYTRTTFLDRGHHDHLYIVSNITCSFEAKIWRVPYSNMDYLIWTLATIMI